MFVNGRKEYGITEISIVGKTKKRPFFKIAFVPLGLI